MSDKRLIKNDALHTKAESSEDKILQFTAALDNKRAFDFVELMGRKPSTEAERKLEFLYNSAHASMREAVRKRIRNRMPALIFRMMTTFLSAVVTVLLGVKISSDFVPPEMTNNVALIISAFMTFVLALSSFNDNYALWVLYTSAAEKYRVIVKEIEYYTAGNENIEMEHVVEIKDHYETVLKMVASRVTELREEDAKGR